MKHNKLLTSASEGLKSFLGVSVPSTEIISTNSYRGVGALPNSGYNFNVPSLGYDVFFSCNGLNDVVKAYEQCPPIFSIVNRQAYAYISGKTWVLKASNGKVATTEKAQKVAKLLARPNMLQNAKQFKAQLAIYLRLFSYCVVIAGKRPVGYGWEDSEQMWIIPPYMCEIEYNKESYFYSKESHIKKIVIRYGNEVTTITNMENVFIYKDITPGTGNVFTPTGAIKILQQNINNLIGIYNSKGTIINYRGALGILTPELDPNGALSASPEEKAELQNDLMQYGIKSGQWKFIVANSAMKWQSMGAKASELMLSEYAQDDVMVCCDALIYPYKLLSNQQSGSLAGSEMNDWKKEHHESFVAPFAEMIDEQLSQMFNLEEEGLLIQTTYSHISFLQADRLKGAQARAAMNNALLVEFQNNMLTLNRWLELNDEDPWKGEGGFGDMYYYQLVEAGWVFGGSGGMKLELTDPNAEKPKAEEKPKV